MLGHIIVVFIAAGPLGLPKRWVHAAGLITVPLSILGLLALGQRMAQWRVRMKEKGAKKEGVRRERPSQLHLSLRKCMFHYGNAFSTTKIHFRSRFEDKILNRKRHSTEYS